MERSPASRRGKTRRKAQIYFTSESCCLHFIVLLVKEWGEEGRGEGLQRREVGQQQGRISYPSARVSQSSTICDARRADIEQNKLADPFSGALVTRSSGL